MPSRIPNFYRPPIGGPLRWQDDVSGELPAAMKAFVDHHVVKTPITPEQIELVREYFEYYINAPCWTVEGMETQFTRLRESIKTLKSVQEIDAWIHQCLEVGIDPM